jgi:hypothetical protein
MMVNKREDTMLYIVIEGGVVQEVCTNDPRQLEDSFGNPSELEVTIIDYDMDGSESPYMSVVTDTSVPDGRKAEASVFTMSVVPLDCTIESK